MTRFFSPGPARDLEYAHLRDMPDDRVGQYRDFVESLWERYRGNEDKNFLSNSKDHFSQRFWEMYLWVALTDMGFSLSKEGSAGPDFFIEMDGRRYWVEAVCPMRGNNPDSIPEEMNDGEWRAVPVREIMLTYTNAINKKMQKHLDDIEKGRAAPGDGYILAVSSAGLPVSARVQGEIPYIVQACYGVGVLSVSIDVGSMKMGDPVYQERLECENKNGAPVSLACMRGVGSSIISGVIHSSARCGSFDRSPGFDFDFLANSEADSPLSWERLSSMRRWRFIDGFLECYPRNSAPR